MSTPITTMHALVLHNLAAGKQRFLRDVRAIQDLTAEGLIEPLDDGHGWTTFGITEKGRAVLKAKEALGQ